MKVSLCFYCCYINSRYSNYICQPIFTAPFPLSSIVLILILSFISIIDTPLRPDLSRDGYNWNYNQQLVLYFYVVSMYTSPSEALKGN